MMQRKRRRSALETFDGCPHRFNTLYNVCQCGHHANAHLAGTQLQVGGPGLAVDPLREPCQACDCQDFHAMEDKGDESQRGIAFHECVFRYVDRLVEANTDAEGVVGDGFASDAEEASLAFQEGIALSQLPFHLVDHVKRLWDRFTGWFQLDLRAYAAAEQRQEDERFTWIPDLVYMRPQGVKITDWKTYFKGLTEAQALKEFQLKFYLWHALQLWPGFPAYTFEFNFVRLGYAVSVTLTPDQIEAFRDEVLAIDLAMNEAERTGSYPAIPGSHCTLCRLACPLVDNPERTPIRLVTKDQAEKAFGEVLVLEQRLKTLKKSLDGWCTQEGPLVFRGQEYRHWSQQTVNYALPAVIDATTPGQQALIRLSKSTLKPVWKKQGDVPASVVATAAIGQRWTFKHRKAGAVDEKELGQQLGLTDVLADDDGGDE